MRMPSYPNRLREIRKKHKMSAQQASYHLGISFQYLCDLETGRRGFDIPWLFKLSDFYGASIDYILKRDQCVKLRNKQLQQMIDIIGIDRLSKIARLSSDDMKFLDLFFDMLDKQTKTSGLDCNINELMNSDIPIYSHQRYHKHNNKQSEKPGYQIGKTLTGMTILK
jgi:transcriptional regulator with XRE-family HTH domain